MAMPMSILGLPALTPCTPTRYYSLVALHGLCSSPRRGSSNIISRAIVSRLTHRLVQHTPAYLKSSCPELLHAVAVPHDRRATAQLLSKKQSPLPKVAIVYRHASQSWTCTERVGLQTALASLSPWLPSLACFFSSSSQVQPRDEKCLSRLLRGT